MEDLIISDDTIYTKVARTASLVGRGAVSSDGHSLYDQIRITDQEREEICSYTERSVSDLVSMLGPKVAKYEYNGASYVMSLNYGEEMEVNLDPLYSASVKLIVDSVLLDWFSIVYPTMVQLYTANVAADKSACMNALMNAVSQPVLNGIKRQIVEINLD